MKHVQRALAALVLALIAVVLPAANPPSAVAQVAADGNSSVQFVVDVSGSMGGSRIVQAKAALNAAVDALPPDQPAGLRSFAGSCSNGGVQRVAVGTGNRVALHSAINALTTGGGTPTPQALISAVANLPEDPDGRIIVLISDGQSSCGDPCPTAQALAASEGVDFTVHTVGFQTSGNAETQLQCIADETGGTYVPASDTQGLIDAITQALSSGVRYNQVQQKSSHNSYQRQEALIDQLTFHRVRSIELDIHNGKKGHDTRDNDWLVYHDKGDRGTTCNRLSDCLDELGAFHDANPDHEVVTVFVDLKNDWEAGRMPLNLDDQLTRLRHMGRGAIVTPSDVRDLCTRPSNVDLLTAVTGDCAWPTLDQLRGKFMFVLTGDTSRLDAYHPNGGDIAFIAPQVDDIDLAALRTDVIFYNHKDPDADLAQKVFDAGLVLRLYDLGGVLDSDLEGFVEFSEARGSMAHHLGTDHVNYLEDPWARTHSDRGFPFDYLLEERPETLSEGGNVLSVKVESGEIKGGKDSFHFAYLENPGVVGTWDAQVSTANSHIEDKGQGCLMARENLSSNSPYFAMCRYADDNRVHAFWMDSEGEKFKVGADIAPKDTVDKESISFISLRIVESNGQYCVSGRAGLTPGGFPDTPDEGFQTVAQGCFDDPLVYQGVASASKKDTEPLTFLYSRLRIDEAVLTTADLTQRNIGKMANGLAYDGIWSGDGPVLPSLIGDYDSELDEAVDFVIPVWDGYGITRMNFFIMPQSICLIPGISPTCGQGDNRGFVSGAEIGDWSVPARVKLILDHEAGVATVIAYRTHNGIEEVPALPIDLENVNNIRKLPPDYPSSFRIYDDGIREIREGGIGFDFRFINSVTPEPIAGLAPAITGAVLVEQLSEGRVSIDFVRTPYPSIEIIRDSYNPDNSLSSTLIWTQTQNVDDPWGLFGGKRHDIVVG